MYNKLTSQRILSIDAFRGVTIAIMVFVNELSGIRDIPAWMKHMPKTADAMSFVDVVFPAFLFIAGMSIPFALNNRIAKHPGLPALCGHIIWRTIGLLTLGVFMVNDEGGDYSHMPISIHIWSFLFYFCAILIWRVYPARMEQKKKYWQAVGITGLVVLAIIYRGGESGHEVMSPRWWGILGLIGWAYVVSCFSYLLTRGKIPGMLLIIVLLTIFYGLTIRNEWNDFPAKNGTHVVLMLAGIISSLLMFDENLRFSFRDRILLVFGLAGLFFLAGFCLRPAFPLSKINATPSWGFYCCGICILIYLFLYWLVDMKKIQGWYAFFRPAAASPLLTYLIPDIIYNLTAFFHFRLFPGKWAYGWPGGLYVVAFTILVLLIARGFEKVKLRLQL